MTAKRPSPAKEEAKAARPKEEKPKTDKAKEGKAPKEQQERPAEKPAVVFATGKRKTSVARAAVKKGSGTLKVNYVPIELVPNRIARMKMMEPLIIAEDLAKSYDIVVDVKGGGIMGQAEAVRQAVAKGLADMEGPELRKKFLAYDRNLLVYDPRRAETRKPPRSSKGSRRYKQRSKR